MEEERQSDALLVRHAELSREIQARESERRQVADELRALGVEMPGLYVRIEALLRAEPDLTAGEIRARMGTGVEGEDGEREYGALRTALSEMKRAGRLTVRGTPFRYRAAKEKKT